MKKEELVSDRPQRPKPGAQKKIMTDEEVRQLLLSTITKIKKNNEWEKQLSQQKFQMKMHEKMEKTYDVTRKENTKFINMFRDQMNQLREREEQRALEHQERS